MNKNVHGYSGLYQIDDNGNVYSCERVVASSHPRQKSKAVRGRLLSARPDMRGYMTVSLSKDGKTKNCRVHRLMMLTFCFADGCELLDVNHIDGDKKNNSLSNLEWATRSENISHSFHVLNRKRTMVGKFGSLHHNSKPVVGYNKLTMEKVHEFDSLASADRAGFCMSKISQCLSGQRKTHKGLIWTPPNIEPFINKDC